MKSFQELPIDLFDHLIKSFKGITTSSNSDQFGLIRVTQDRLYIIHKDDYRRCHPGYPYTGLSLYTYQPTVNDFIEKGINTFNDKNDNRLKGKLYFQVSSSRMDERHPYFNLLFSNHCILNSDEQFLIKDIKYLEDFCKIWVEQKLLEQQYGFDNSSNQGARNVKYWEDILKLKDINPKLLLFFKELENNREFNSSWDEYNVLQNA